MKRARELTPMIPQGVHCYFGEEVHRRRRVEAILAAIMKNWGFHEIILPFFDYLEDFSYGLGSQLGDRVYRFLDRDGSLLALRPDLTTLVAKTVATRMTDHQLPIQLFYSGEVFRHERAGAGKQKEFYQIGLESMGSAALWADIEAILIAIDCLQQLGIGEFRIALGHVGIFHGIVSSLGLVPEQADDLREAIDRRDCAWLEREVGRFDLPEDKKLFLAEMPNYAGGREVLDAALDAVENTQARRALLDLAGIHDVVASLGLADLVTFDLAEVRGLDYYSGILFKIYGPLHGFELGGGGRYDGLPGKFGWDIPAVGFSFTLDRLLPLIRDVDMLRVPSHDAEEHALAVEGMASPELFRRAWELRRQGVRIRMGRDR